MQIRCFVALSAAEIQSFLPQDHTCFEAFGTAVARERTKLDDNDESVCNGGECDDEEERRRQEIVE